MTRRAIIANRVFWWLYPDGRKERIYANERIRAHLSQVNSAVTKGNPVPHDFATFAGRSNDELAARYGVNVRKVAEWRKLTGLHYRAATSRALPVAGQYDETLTLAELGRACGYGCGSRFSMALRTHRPEIHARAVANGRARSGEHLKRLRKKEEGE
jgi:hypothetical protein